MSWRNLLVKNPTALSLKDGQVFCKRADGEDIFVPLEDIASITLESPRATVTAPLLGSMASHGVSLISCDGAHMPNGILLPFGAHSRALAAFKRQIAWTLPFKKRLWQKIIQRKIANQYQLLRHLGKPDKPLLRLSELVDSGDSKNKEAQAAKRYFSLLFSDFKRGSGDIRNAAMNYGYAVARATVARDLAHFGFHPALGIFHHNELNAFNLADDLLEPFRPLVDGWAFAVLSGQTTGELSSEHRAKMTQVLQIECTVGGERHRLQHAVHLCIKSLSGMDGKSDYSRLLLPYWDGNAALKEVE